MGKPIHHQYVVTGQFERSRAGKHERWKGRARSMLTATRKAVSQIMKRQSVKRLRHHKIIFTVERADD